MARKAASKKRGAKKTTSGKSAGKRKTAKKATRGKSSATAAKRDVVVEVQRVPKSGKWILKEKGEDAARASFDEKSDAVAAAKVLAKAEKGN